MWRKIVILIVIVFCMFQHTVSAQFTRRFTYHNTWLSEAKHQYEQARYKEVYHCLNKLSKQAIYQLTGFEKEDYQFYKNAAALKLNKPFCEKNMLNYIAKTHYGTYKQRAYYSLAKYYYSQADYEQAMPYYELAGIAILDNNEISERNFELGYCYLVNQQLDKVDPLFASIKNIRTEYFTPGNYYYGVLSYYKKNYEDAVASFEKVKDDNDYKKVVPFYLTELNYIRGQKDKALKDALALLNASEKTYYDIELNALVGQIYMEQDNYDKATEYLSTYVNNTPNARSEDKYRLAKALYETGSVQEALPYFEQIDEKSNYHRLAKYYTAVCNLKMGNKQKAYQILTDNLNLFNTNTSKENIEFTIGKLSYDLGNEALAITQLNYFINQNPTSKYSTEANEMLSYLYLKNKQFDEAIRNLNKLPALTPVLKNVYTKANYARGIQMLLANNPEEASYHFDECKKYKTDEQEIKSLSVFWNAEANYRLGRYQNAIHAADEFLNDDKVGASFGQYARNAHLLKAYAYLHNNDKLKMADEIRMSRDVQNDVLNSVTPLVLSDSIKPNFVPVNVPSIITSPFLFVYNMPDEQVNLPYKPIPLKPLALNTAKSIQPSGIPSFLKAGYGNKNTPILDLGVSVIDKKNTDVYAKLNYIAQKDTIQNEMSRFNASIAMNKKIKEHLLETQFLHSKNKYTFFGFDRSIYKFETNNIRQSFTHNTASVRLTSLYAESKKFNYKPSVTIGRYTDNDKAKENSFLLTIPLTTSFNGADFTLTGLANMFHFTKGTEKNINSLLSIQPKIDFNVNDIHFTTGIYPTLANGESKLLYHLAASKKLAKNTANLKIALNSSIIQNTFQELSTINPYLFTSYSKKQTQERSVIASLDGSFANKTDYTLKAGLVNYLDLPFFINDTSGDYKQFNILYEQKVKTVLVDVALNYYLNKHIYLGGQLQLKPILGYGNLRNANFEPWHYQSYIARLYATYLPTDRVTLKALCFVQPGVKVIEKKLSYTTPLIKINNSAIDMNIMSEFKLSNKLACFIDINNLFGSKYQRWHGYSTVGTNFQVGFIKNFQRINK